MNKKEMNCKEKIMLCVIKSIYFEKGSKDTHVCMIKKVGLKQCIQCLFDLKSKSFVVVKYNVVL